MLKIEKMYVRITSSKKDTMWYKVGDIHEVKYGSTYKYWDLTKDNTYLVEKDDCEVIDVIKMKDLHDDIRLVENKLYFTADLIYYKDINNIRIEWNCVKPILTPEYTHEELTKMIKHEFIYKT